MHWDSKWFCGWKSLYIIGFSHVVFHLLIRDVPEQGWIVDHVTKTSCLTTCLTFVIQSAIQHFSDIVPYICQRCPYRRLYRTVLISCLTFVMSQKSAASHGADIVPYICHGFYLQSGISHCADNVPYMCEIFIVPTFNSKNIFPKLPEATEYY